MINIILGDCLVEMDKLIKQGITVDCILTDPPYGTTACKWDSVIPFDEMWERLNKLIKPNGAIVLFGSEPFSSALRMSNIKRYKYDWVWEKTKPSNFLNCKKQPMRKYENISIFYSIQSVYNPQGLTVSSKHNKNSNKLNTYGKVRDFTQAITYIGYPHNVLRFPNIVGSSAIHPTQKPVALMEYLIKTYTNEGETVLDFTMGSGTTGVACKNTDRKFIGIELDKQYFEIAKERMEHPNDK
jgi:DNA modification methylase